MGQYYKIVNPAKRQYLNPHKFGCGLKLMEFSNSNHGPQSALMILLAHANGRGGGDLNTDNLTDDEKALIGSWAGDPVIVAGDYDDAWLFVPEEFKGKTYTVKEELYRHSNGTVNVYDKLPSGTSSPTGKFKEVTYTFGKRYDRETCVEKDCDETLYSVAGAFFEDISDKVIAIVAKAESAYGHPWACIDTADDGWRSVPQWGRKPEKEPKKPIAGKKVYNAYAKQAIDAQQDLTKEIETFLRKHPDKAGELVKVIMAVKK